MLSIKINSLRQVSNPFGATTNSVGYKTYLEERNPKIQLLSLLKDGIERAAAADNAHLRQCKRVREDRNPANRSNFSSVSPTNFGRRRAKSRRHNCDLKGKITEVTLAAAPQNPTPAAREFEVVQLEIQAISKWIWFIYGGLTALSVLRPDS